MPEKLICQVCRHEVLPLVRWKTMETPESKAHLGAYCPQCSRWIKWLPQSDIWVKQAIGDNPLQGTLL